MKLQGIPQAGQCEECGHSVALFLDEDFYFTRCEADDRHLQMLWPPVSGDAPRSDEPDLEWYVIGGFYAEALARSTGGSVDQKQWRAKMVEEARDLGEILDFGDLHKIWCSKPVRFVIRFARRELGCRSV